MTQKIGKADKWFNEEDNEWTDKDENGHKQWDTDGDGLPDAKDEDDDGNADHWLNPDGKWTDGTEKSPRPKDTDKDGLPDTWYDEKGNEVAKDTDGDGNADKWVDPETGKYPDEEEPEKYPKAKDTNGDGKPDTWVDEKGNEVAKDTDGDGKADKFVDPETGKFPDPNEPEKYPKPLDKNGDGIPDTWVDEKGNEVAKDTSQPPDGKADVWKDPSVPDSDWKNEDGEGNKQWDTNGDGLPDARDTNDDNNADEWKDPKDPNSEWKNGEQSGKGNGKDTDGDGKVDTWYDDSGKKETAWDTDGDEKADSFDTDGDGQLDDDENASKNPDLNGRDKNGGKDTNGDGKPDTWDTNGDGKDDSWDTDGDGNADSWDENGNGNLDEDEDLSKHPEKDGKDPNGGKDTNKDGKPDTWYDENGNVIGKDEDGDGNADKFIDPETQDPNGNGELSDKDRNKNKLFDTDGDGKPDARDTNNDGNADEWKDPETGEWKSSNELPGKPQDKDGDGIPDEWDFNNDGQTDAWDTNKDGKPDQWDTNNDTKVDAWDTDGDGLPDSYDTDNDGSADKWVPSAKEGSIKFKYEPEGWTNTQVKVTLSSEYTENGFKIQYSTDYNELTRNGKWEDGTTVTLKDNGSIYARLKSTKNEDIGGIIKGEVNKIDKVAPTVTVNILEQTTSTIKVKTDVEDKASGLPNPVTYNYYIKEKDGSEDYKLKGTQTVPARLDVKTSTDTFTFTKLTQTTDYDIKVTVEDLVKNVGEGTAQGKTNEVPSGEDNIKFGDVQWDPDNNQASVEVSTTTEYKIRYWTSVDAKNEEHKVIESGEKITVNQDETTIYAELWDETNASNIAKSLTIDDAKQPTMTIQSTITTTRDITITANAVDYQFGMPKPPTYKFYIVESTGTYPTTPTGTSENGTYKYTDAVHNTTYKIKVEVSDFAGNKETQETTAKTQEMPSGEDGQNGLVIEEPQWNSSEHNASVKIKKRNEKDGYILQYNTGNEWASVGSAETSSHTVTVSNDTTVHARLSDGKNVGAETTKLIKDNIVPTVNLTVNETKTNSIKVTATASDAESGMKDAPIYTYSYKMKNEDSWHSAEGTTSTTHTFESLIQGTEYNLKVEVADYVDNKNSKEITQTTNTIPSADDSANGLEFGQIKWDAATHKASVTISKKNKSDGFWIRYKIGDNGPWTALEDGQAVTGRSLNEEIIATLYDGTNYGTVQKRIKITDGSAPNVTVTANTPTTRSIPVTVTAKDDQSGLPSTVVFKYYIKEKTSQTYDLKETKNIANSGQPYTNDSYTFDKLKQATAYDIKVEVTDLASITGNGTTSKETGAVPEGENNIKFESVTWAPAQHTASVKISTTSEYGIRYWTSRNGTHTEITSGNSVPSIIDDTTVFAELWDGVNAGKQASIGIKDKQPPTVSMEVKETKTNSIKVSASASDAESGMQTSPSYTYSYKTSSESNWHSDQATTDTTHTFTGLTQGTTYSVKVEVSDYVGNKGSKDGSSTTGSVPSAKDGTNGLIFGNVSWSSGTGKVTVSKKNTNDGFHIQYRVGGTGNWNDAGIVNSYPFSSITNNTTVYARLWDGTNAGTETEQLIKDSTSPTVTLSYKDVKTNAITVTVDTATDSETGLANPPNFSYYIKASGENWGSAKITQTGKSYTFTGLSQTTTYNIKVEVTDLGSNTGRGETSVQTQTMPEASSNSNGLTFGTETWANGKASITVTKKNENDGYHIQYRVGTGSWLDGGTGKSYTITGGLHGVEVFARLWDGTTESKNFGKEGSKKITDSTAPTIGVTVDSVTTNTINITYAISDAQSGVNNNTAFTIKYKKQSDSSWQTLGGTHTATLQSGVYKGTAQIANLESGESAGVTYNIEASASDIAGVKGSREVSGVTQQMPGGSSVITISPATWVASTHTATVTISHSKPGFTLYYWTSGDSIKRQMNSGNSVTELTHNTTVFAQLSDGKNYGASVSAKITDGLVPNAAKITLGSTSIKKGVSTTATVTQTDDQSGVNIAECRWAFNTTSGDLGLTSSEYIGTFKKDSGDVINISSSSGGTYYFHVLTVDNAGNKEETNSGSITIKSGEGYSDLRDQVYRIE